MRSWTTERTGITVTTTPAIDGLEPELADSIGLALRRNPRRAQLLVSTVLGKHVPVRASLCLRAGQRLAEAVPHASGYDVIGFAETATGLGHQVARGLRARAYLQTTRRPATSPHQLHFLEEHSHATDQTLDPAPGTFDPDRVMVLVDDEISTGRTALNALAVLVPALGHRTWVLASLLDSRSPEDRETCARWAAAQGIELLDACLLTGSVTVPDGLDVSDLVGAPETAYATGTATTVLRLGTAGVRTDARRAFSFADDAALQALAHHAAGQLDLGPDLLVVGGEELMYFPQLLALALGDAPVCSTTRSPALAVDDPGYPLRTALAFSPTSGPAKPVFSYNTVRTGTTLLVTQDRLHGPAATALASGGADVVVLQLDPSLPAGVVQ